MHGIQSEYEIYSGNFLKFMLKASKKKHNLEKLQEKMLDYITELKTIFEQYFFNELDVGSINSNDESAIREELLNKTIYPKAAAWYIASYYNSNCDILGIVDFINSECTEEYDRILKRISKIGQQLIGMPWICISDYILTIKKSAFKKKAI